MNTKTQAFHQLHFISELQTAIYNHLRKFPDLISDEIAYALGLTRSTVTGRLNELEKMGLIEVSKLKVNIKSGHLNQSYRVISDYDSALDAVQSKMIQTTYLINDLGIDLKKVCLSISRELLTKEINRLKKDLKYLEQGEKILSQMI